MELTLSKRDRDAIVQQLRISLRKDIKAMLQDTRQPEMIPTSKAAEILGITAQSLRQIVHDDPQRYPHIKRGSNKQAKLLFDRNALLS